MITVGGSFFGAIYFVKVKEDKTLFYFRSKETLDDFKEGYECTDEVFRSIENQRRHCRKEFLFEPTEIMTKNYLLVPNSLEIFDKPANKFYFFNFFTPTRQKVLMNKLKYFCMNIIEDYAKDFKEKKYEEKWADRKISSLDYLMLINKYSSRSFNDTSQYPIMPWVGP